jgi:hypothetical protein
MHKLNRPFFTNRIHLSIKGQLTPDGKFDWKEAALDAGIISSITLFTGLGALAAAGTVNVNGLIVLLSATGSVFMGIIATKRGLTPKKY